MRIPGARFDALAFRSVGSRTIFPYTSATPPKMPVERVFCAIVRHGYLCGQRPQYLLRSSSTRSKVAQVGNQISGSGVLAQGGSKSFTADSPE